MPETPGRRGLLPLLLVSGVVMLVAAGLARGVWLPNLHNGLLALAFTFVGAYVLFQRPGHREGVVFMAAGAVSAVLFLGRQVGHTSDGATWPAWLGVWPVAVGIALSTLAVILFPDGRLPSPRWRWVVTAIVAVAACCSLMSALWPVEYANAGLDVAHPLALPGAGTVEPVWRAVALTAYPVFQLLWLAAVVARWRGSGRLVRVQLAWVGLAAAVSAGCLVVGMAGWQSPRAGLLTAALVPVAAGWAIVHGQHLAAYSALSWLSRSGGPSQGLPADLARAVAESLGAPAATLWIGDADELHAVGVHPEGSAGPTPIGALRADPELTLRPVESGGALVGAITLRRPAADRLSRPEQRLLDDLAAQAVLVLDHLALARDAARERATADLGQLSPREREVLELMARGLSNAAICRELHLSIKTVEPAISSVFSKLGLGQDTASNRRVLAVLAFLRTPGPPVEREGRSALAQGRIDSAAIAPPVPPANPAR